MLGSNPLPVRCHRLQETRFAISIAREDGRVVVTLDGELDMSTLPAFMAGIADALGPPAADVLIDTRQLSYADSSAIRGFLQAKAAADAHGSRMGLANVSGALERTLSMAGIREMFTTCDT
jgi:anti-anti-sigma factor